jgi:squalene-hopene/tetraprenyl-beta-curcumene cyclase
VTHPPSRNRIESAYQMARSALLAERTTDGHWIGELSNSALSTATAVSALALTQKATSTYGSFDSLITNGVRWIAEHQNADGGWGDTVRSFSNISTTMLCRAAFHLTDHASANADCLSKANAWLAVNYGQTPEQLAEAVRRRYGKDRTFSVPILMTSALAGLVSWSEVPALPFELACLPQSFYRFLHLPVVSYALPALIAIGQSIFHHQPPILPVRLLRGAAINRSLRVLQSIQPLSGGFLEAAPLTSFVALGLVSSGQASSPVVRKAIEFLTGGVQPDGSWPIDTNLSVWVTTLSVNALAAADDLHTLDRTEQLYRWIIERQGLERHPSTGADPGGWGWSHLSGSVPDADDSPGALLALHNLSRLPHLAHFPRVNLSMVVRSGLRWLLDMQNRDGGWPTFCRGWGALPFDRSGVDLTAHVLRAFAAWHGIMGFGDGGFRGRLSLARKRGLLYLQRMQREDGSWLPLWFGNQHVSDDENPTYGTCKVLAAYRDLDRMSVEPARRGVRWLLSIQNADGGWGGAAAAPSSMEETALAVEVLLAAGPPAQEAVNNGLAWLVQQGEAGQLNQPTPIGFYFAKLWYFEKLYPIIFTIAALGRARRHPPNAT